MKSTVTMDRTATHYLLTTSGIPCLEKIDFKCLIIVFFFVDHLEVQFRNILSNSLQLLGTIDSSNGINPFRLFATFLLGI